MEAAVPRFEEHDVGGDGDCFLHALRCALGDGLLHTAFDGALTPLELRRWLVGQARTRSRSRTRTVYRSVLEDHCWDATSSDAPPDRAPETPIIAVVNRFNFKTFDDAVGSKAFESAVLPRSYFMTHYEIVAIGAQVLARTGVAVLTPDWRDGRTRQRLKQGIDLAFRQSVVDTRSRRMNRPDLYVVLPNVGGHYRYVAYAGDDNASLIQFEDLTHIGSSKIAIVAGDRCEKGRRVNKGSDNSRDSRVPSRGSSSRLRGALTDARLKNAGLNHRSASPTPPGANAAQTRAPSSSGRRIVRSILNAADHVANAQYEADRRSAQYMADHHLAAQLQQQANANADADAAALGKPRSLSRPGSSRAKLTAARRMNASFHQK